MSNQIDTDDLQLLSLLVTNMLRHEHCQTAVPRSAYGIVKTSKYPLGQDEVRIAVELGRGLNVVVEEAWRADDARRAQTLFDAAERITNTISSLKERAGDLGLMLREVRSATKREVAKAKRRGLSHAIANVSLAAVETGCGRGPDILVEVEVLGRSLRMEVHRFHADCAKDVVEWFADKKEEQESRRSLREDLEALGATGRIDAVLVNELKALGFEMRDVLAKLRSAEDWIVDLDLPDGTRTTLYWKEGSVFSQVILGDDASWNEGRLNLKTSPCALTSRQVGRRLNEIFTHPLLSDDLVIDRCHGNKGEWGTIYCSTTMLKFDDESGRLWQ